MRSVTGMVSLALAVTGVMVAATTSAFASIAVPEPMTSVVFGAGLVGAAVLGRRFTKK